MIDVGKKITSFFAKCSKMIFSLLHLKFAKSAIMTKKKLGGKNFNMGIKKTQHFLLVSNSLTAAFKNALKQAKSNKTAKNAKKLNLNSFLAIDFFRGICLSRHQRI